MDTVSMTGNDTLVLNNRVLADFGPGDIANLTYPNEMATLDNGKGGNTVYAFNAKGAQAELEIDVIRGSADDKFFNNLLTQQSSNFAGFVLMQGEFTKKVGDGKGNITNDQAILSGGIFVKRPAMKSNVAGDTSQSITKYVMRFSKGQRTIG